MVMLFLNDVFAIYQSAAQPLTFSRRMTIEPLNSTVKTQ
jgi:hypothetical protein